ncbi:hypothetical protein AYO20_07319 [Fonsecaea nubica]|uniref:Uncharacterized protein n=1 Tax=Fonsecaea nubica TaxID=856822 RepID=A0A178CWD1_9EURO|nr:hypothetical protein AYO20_07319 [Fonsecaea nubica]OAL33463.1 hypothetical protein AYO20_07319 [Fonsecaea nubica]
MPIIDKDVPQTISIPSATLRKFSGSRVDPYTRYVAYRLFRDLNISVQGQRNINNALSNLPVHVSVAPGEKLSFGWGLSNVIRDQAVHEGSYEHLAMMIALGESFHEPYGARVLMAMADAAAGPDDMTPHFSQWQAALHGCNGIFATSDFGLLVEDYLQIDPYPIVYPMEGVKRIDDVFPPSMIAEALRALMRVTKGEAKHVTLIGSGIISWFAAIAEWLCDLRIVVYQKDGKELRVTHPDQEPQLTLVFVPEAGIKASFDPWKPSGPAVEEMSLIDRTYSATLHTTRFGGRVAWQSLLPRVFGKSFHHLDHDNSKAFGTMIGSAARMFEGLAHGKGHEDHGQLVSVQNQSNTASYGAGLIETITNWLPELRRFQGRMERSLKLSHEDASASYVENLTKIRKACHCGICTSKDEVDKDKEGHPPDHGYCLAVLVETVISLGLALARMAVSARLFPTRSGIYSFYQSQVARRMEARGLHWTMHFKLVYGNVWNAPDAVRLQNSLQIFAGSRPQGHLPENLVALSHEGCCAYFMDLEKRMKSSSDCPQVKLIRVVPGGINVGEKVFDRACLGPIEDADPDDPWEAIIYEHLPEPLFCK